MSATFPLFDLIPTPRSRTSDPASSKRAEQRIRESGALRGQQKIALDLVKEFPGKSSKELSHLGTLDRYQMARRLSDLFHANLVWRQEREKDDCAWFAK